MQSQPQLGGQGGLINNAPQLAMNGLSTAGIGSRCKPWHSDEDTGLRHEIFRHIMKVFHKPGLESKLSGIKYLEEALYRNAASKEEYADLNTLERRIHVLMLRLKTKQNFPQHGSQTAASFSTNTASPLTGCASTMLTAGSNTMIPSPKPGGTILSVIGGAGSAVKSGANGSTVACETNILASCQGLTNNMFSPENGQAALLEKRRIQLGQNSQVTSATGMPLSGGSQRIPTSGLSSVNSSTGPTPQSVNGVPFNQLKQNQTATGSVSCQVYPGLRSEQDAGGCNGQLKSSSMGLLHSAVNDRLQCLGGAMNSTSAFPAGYLASTQHSTVHTRPQQHVGQRVLHMLYGKTSNLAAGDGFATNATDVTGSGSFYNSVLSGGPTACTLATSSLSSPLTNMIPVPGLLSQQHRSESLLNQPVHNLSQNVELQQNSNMRMSSQQQHQLARSIVNTSCVGPKEHAIETQSSLTEGPFNSLPSQDTLEQLVSNQHQSQMMGVQQSLLQNPQPEQQIWALSNSSSLNYKEHDHHENIEQPLHLRFASGKQQTSDQLVEQNEQTCQATAHSALSITNDTGQPEVVSNNESLVPGHANLAPGITRAHLCHRQQCWLLYLRHASKCTIPEGQCIARYCSMGRKLWAHINNCRDRSCKYPQCVPSRTLLSHHQHCRNTICPVCAPVRSVLLQYRMQSVYSQLKPASSAPTVIDEGTSPQAKRVKVEISACSTPQIQEQHQQSVITEHRQVQASYQEASSTQHQIAPSTTVEDYTEPYKLNRPGGCRFGQSSFNESLCGSVPSADLQVKLMLSRKMSKDTGIESQVQARDDVVNKSTNLSVVQLKPESVIIQAKQESVASVSVSTNDVSPTSAKAGKMKVPGISYIEFFDTYLIREHIYSLRQWIGQSKSKAEKNQAMGHQMVPDACPVCAVEKLYFEASPIYCILCGTRVKRNALYYTPGSGETHIFFCIPCYNSRPDIIQVGGSRCPKSLLEKRKNDEQQEEAWVECDKCEKWQHQICALFNVRINDGERAEYTCPECCIAEMERGERTPYLQNAVLGAKDLPRTFLSDYIEERLTWKLEQERIERAKVLGKSPLEVPGAEGLVVRVVSSVDKKLEVKQHFLELFHEQDYPIEFLYKSKMLLLFQKIEGVEVCLFGMYVQEFGAECSQPNQRRVYLAYLDSVKYFRPDVKTANGQALRTFVYHEILIAYLDYCKKRGFTSCYIWACPPLKGEDYILYCHPEIQKTPKSDKLRDWYLSMIGKAKKENIVIANRNIYEYFFTASGECKAKVTAARLPYFDGDYLPGAAEDIIMQLQEEDEGNRYQKRGNTKKVVTKRSCKAAAHDGLGSNASRDLQLMQKLGDTIFAMREDFIMVHLQHTCTHCRGFVIAGYRWVCQQCSNDFQLCNICYEAEQRIGEGERHPAGKKECHPLVPIEVDGVPANTQDRDEVIESEFFDTRHAFLSLCQGNHYQYDTLRRAKHSSMMVLYHLHNPSAPAFTTPCNICNRENEVGQGWKCETCFDYDVCSACYSNPEVQRHPHKLVLHPSVAGSNAQNKEARKQRLLELRKMLELLVHASQCPQSSCEHAKCRNMKDLFRHGNHCKTRMRRGCGLCRRMWYLLQAHARSCRERNCRVPRCMDLKEHSRRCQLQQESRRRAAVNEMMRERAAEAAAGSG